MVQNNRDMLLKALNILQKSREYNVHLLKSDPYIHQACFKYRKSPAAMALVIDRYRTDFLNYHFKLMDGENDFVKEKIARIVSRLIENGLNIKNSKFGYFLLNDKKRVINEMLKVSDEMQDKYNRLLVSIERDKVRYEEEVEKIINGEIW